MVMGTSTKLKGGWIEEQKTAGNHSPMKHTTWT